jgi:hypothetical protein
VSCDHGEGGRAPDPAFQAGEDEARGRRSGGRGLLQPVHAHHSPVDQTDAALADGDRQAHGIVDDRARTIGIDPRDDAIWPGIRAKCLARARRCPGDILFVEGDGGEEGQATDRVAQNRTGSQHLLAQLGRDHIEQQWQAIVEAYRHDQVSMLLTASWACCFHASTHLSLIWAASA